MHLSGGSLQMYDAQVMLTRGGDPSAGVTDRAKIRRLVDGKYVFVAKYDDK